MELRDQELLDKQLSGLHPAPRNDGVIVLTVLAVFFTGMALGGFLVGYESGPVRIASNISGPVISQPSGAAPTLRQ